MTISLRSAPNRLDDFATKTSAHSTTLPQFDAVSLAPVVKRARLLSTLYQRLHSFNQATPIGSLPPELLCHIFELAHLKAGNFRPWHHPDQRRLVPFTVSQVSGHWREVALNSPLLWSYIDISPPWSFSTICLAFSRTKDCPLTINLTVPEIAFGNLLTPSVINTNANVLCGIIAPHIPRCRKLIIKGDFTQLEHLFTSLMKTLHNSPTPLLEQLVILPTGVRHTLAKLHPHSLVHHAPLLSHLRATTGMVCSLPSLDGLTSLHLAAGDGTALELSDFAAIASSCPHLETLAIFDEAVWGPWPLEAVVDFPSLRSLQIYGSFMSVSDLLRVVEAPLLEDLVIAPFARDDLADYHQYTAHRDAEGLDPKFAGLRSITLSPVGSSGFALIEAAECFPNVELVMIPNIQTEFQDVFIGEGAQLVWPNLKGLALRNIDCQAMERLLAVIAFREASGSPLETLYLDHGSMLRVSSMIPPTISLLAYDIWSTLRNEDLLQEPAHFVGNDFDFIPY